MLKGIKARIGLIMVGFLALCGLAVGIMNAFAEPDSAVVTFEVEPAVVELNGTDGGEFSVSLIVKEEGARIRNLEGNFTTTEWNEGMHENPYIMADEITIGELFGSIENEEHDVGNGHFSFEINGNGFFGGNETIYTMHYNVSPDTPAGVYSLPIHIRNLTTQTAEGATDIDESDDQPILDVEITVKRPHEVVFYNHDQNDSPFIEVTKYYGEPDFRVVKNVTTGGEIVDYYIDYENSGEAVAYISYENSEYIQINEVGSASFCVDVAASGYYLDTTSCFTVNVERRPIYVKELAVHNKSYDGSTDVEIDYITFEQDTTLEPGHYLPLDLAPSYYEAYAVLDSPDIGNRTATVEINLLEEGSNYYDLVEGSSYETTATVTKGVLDDISASFEPQTYDPDAEYQYFPIVLSSTLTDYLEITLEQNVDFELIYNGGEIKDAGDYVFTVSPLDESMFTFEPFEATFTIEQKEIEEYAAMIDSKEYDRSTDAEVNYVYLSEDNLEEGVDYEVTAHFYDADAGYQSGIVRIDLLNPNYYFYSEFPDEGYNYNDEYDHHSDHAFFEVYEIEITPRELTDENTYYDWADFYDSFEQGQIPVYEYSGEEIQPWVTLSVSFDGGFPEDPLSQEEEYIIEYEEDLVNAGTKYLTLTGVGNFSGSIGPLEYRVIGAEVSNLEISDTYATYTGEALEPEPEVTAIYNNTRITIPASNYIIMEHDDFVNVGEYSYGIAPAEDANFIFVPTELTFVIYPYEISSSNISLSESTYKYNGTSQTPDVTVTVGNTAVSEDDYTVEYSEDTVGNDESDTTVTVTVVAKDEANIYGDASTTYTITPRDVLTISGIENNQQIIYTGSPVILDGNVVVEENLGGITADDLTITWYANDGTTAIGQPTNAGSYKVVYSYEDADYRGALVVNFEITKADSPTPAEMSADFRIISGQTLANLGGERTVGFAWADSNATIVQGNNVYPATYTYNNDTENYETLALNVPVYGLVQVDVNTADSEGGEIAVSSQNILEGETLTITVTPDFGYVLSSITVNGVNYIGSVNANTLTVVAKSNDLEIVATFVPIVYEVVEGAEQKYIIDENSGAKFKINANYELFENAGTVYVDGALVNPKNYTSWSGSTYIEFINGYINTLAVGTHTLKVVFNDGGTATATFTIAESESESEDENRDEDKDEGESESENKDESEGEGKDGNEGDDKDGGGSVAPNTGFFTTVGGGVTVAIGSPVVMFIVVLTITRKIQRHKRQFKHL